MGFIKNFKTLLTDNFDGINGISEVSRRHRKSVLFTSICLIVLDQSVELTLGKASLGGLGIGISPEQVIPIYKVLLLVLTYFCITFWVSISIETGLDIDRVKKNLIKNDKDTIYIDCDSENNVKDSSDIHVAAEEVVSKWEFRKILWEIVMPTTLAFVALIKHLFLYFVGQICG